jgi:predicted nucleic acid-binding protein
MAARPIVLDANILIRFVLGKTVPALLTAHAPTIDFLAPDTAFGEARRHLPSILRARGDDGTGEADALAALEALTAIVTPVPASSYEPMRTSALARIGQRDPHDWPVLACALLLNCPIWTEDRDFFGTGVATWTTSLVRLYFTDPDPGSAEH